MSYKQKDQKSCSTKNSIGMKGQAALEYGMRIEAPCPGGCPRATPRWEMVPSRRQRVVPDLFTRQSLGIPRSPGGELGGSLKSYDSRL